MPIPAPFESTGVFWRPSTPECQVHGVVKISESGEVTLNTFGIVNESPSATDDKLLPAPHPPRSNSAIGRIVGITKHRLITMDGCFYGPSNYHPNGGISDSTIHSRQTYFGARYEIDELPSFDSMTFWLAGLQEWLMFSGFTFDPADTSTTISWAPVEPISISLANDDTLTFELSSSSPSVGLFPDSVTIGQQAHVTIATSEPKPIEYFIAAIRPLEMLLSLAMDRPTGITKIVGESPSLVHKTDDEDYRVPIDVFSEVVRFPVDPPDVGWYHMLFTYRDVEYRFAERLRSWHAYCEDAEPAINLHFATISGAYRYLEARFLSSAQAIEALHRRTAAQVNPLPDAEFERLLSTVEQSVPQEHQQFIIGRLRYANEPSFRRRLKDVFEPYRHHFEGETKLSLLLQEILDARNYLTHYDSDTARKAPDSKTLIGLQYQLEALFQMHLLQALQFDSSDIDDIVDKRLRHKLNIRFL